MILEDIVLGDEGETLKKAEMDLLMMLLFGGIERTLEHWRTLLANVTPPLEIVRIWETRDDFQAVLEVKLKLSHEHSE